MPPSMPQARATLIRKKPPLSPLSTCRTKAPAASAPITNCPSAPILKILARKQIARPTEISSRGISLTPTSAQPFRSRKGSRKKTFKPARGFLPRDQNKVPATTMVSNTASKGEHQAIKVEGVARVSSLNMLVLRPQTAHPLPDLINTGLRHGNRGRHTTFGDNNQTIGDRKQFIQFFRDHQQGTAGIAQGQQFSMNLGSRPNVHAPGRLGNHQNPGLTGHF